MTTRTHKIYEWMAHPEALNRDTLHELRALVERYPYFQTARLLYLRNLVSLQHPDLADALRQTAVYVTDRQQLFRLMEAERLRLISEASPSEEEKKEEAPDRTLALIDDFLAEMGKQAEAEPTEAMPRPEMPVDMTAYLTQDLPDAPPANPMPGQHLIDQFLEEKPTPMEEEQEEEQEEADETDETEEKQENDPEEDYFTETLAKIYIKQQRYSKAIEIIKKLYLKYPKKNVYFADQIRFLEKLIINNKSK
jgi:tetratricopeptide (TPR) repeat protein